MVPNPLHRQTAQSVVAGLILFLLLPGVGRAQSATRYKDPDHFSFDVPAGWQQNTESPRPLVIFAAPKANNFAMNVNVNSELVNTVTLAQYIKAAKGQFDKVNKEQNLNTPNQKGVKINRLTTYDEKATKLGGLPAYTWRLHINLPGKPAVEERQIFCIRDRRAYAITFTTLKPDMKQNEVLFDKMLASFKWDK